MSKKLTPAMQDLLDAMRKGVVVHYMSFSRYSDAYYFRTDTHAHCTKQVHGLKDRGYLRIEEENYKTIVRLVTDAEAK